MLRHFFYFCCFFIGCFIFCFEQAYAKVKVTPVANIDLLGGQYWVSDSMPTAFSGNIEMFVSPVLNFSPKMALLPIYSGKYRGTKDVEELVGGGTLTQQSQDHSLSFKFVNKLSPLWKVKARVGYKLEYLIETEDESWGNGLFDYNKMIVGAEVERLWKKVNGRFGVDYYTMKYPNYNSLVSEDTFESSIDTITYSEISTQAGENVLDYDAIVVFVESIYKLSSKLYGKAHYDISMKNFKDQKTVQKTGEFSSDLRKDIVHYLLFGLDLATPRTQLSLFDSVQYYDSNQNSFDAGNSHFTSDYYDYLQNELVPSITFLLCKVDNPIKFVIFCDISYRTYMERMAQNSDASYKDKKISQVINTTGISLTYPLMDRLSAKFVSNYSDSTSNMRYEANYQYNYYTFNYFVGINWEY